jgi:hypothetical protein
MVAVGNNKGWSGVGGCRGLKDVCGLINIIRKYPTRHNIVTKTTIVKIFQIKSGRRDFSPNGLSV